MGFVKSLISISLYFLKTGGFCFFIAKEDLKGELRSCEGDTMTHSVGLLCWLTYSVIKISLI